MTRDLFKTLKDSAFKIKRELLRTKITLTDIASELVENFNENGVYIDYFIVNERETDICFYGDYEKDGKRESAVISLSNGLYLFTLIFIGISNSDKNIMEKSIKEYCKCYNALFKWKKFTKVTKTTSHKKKG